MKIHHLNCGCMCPSVGRWLPGVFPQKVVCHCLLIESKLGLLLIDTGFAKSVLEKPYRMGMLSPLLGLQASAEDAAISQIQRLGFSAEDVRHIIPTHLDADHAGAVVDFPRATVHTSEQELDAAEFPDHFVDRVRYAQFRKPRDQKWQVHAFDTGENWFGFQGVRPLPEMNDDILLIPLFGHTAGHFGVAVKVENGWLFHVGDAYYRHSELTEEPTFQSLLFHTIAHRDVVIALENQKRLSELKKSQGHQIKIFCAHDPDEME